MSSSTIVCPQCSAAIPNYEDCINWCDHCEWNVRGTTETEPTTLLDKFYTAMSKSHSDALFRSIVAAGQVRPPVTAVTVLVYVIAACVHLFTVCVALASITLITLTWPNFFAILVGGCGLGFVWLARPQLPPVPTVLNRTDFPALYTLVDDIADALGSQKVDGISIDGRYNAAFRRAGWSRKRILRLGLPLWVVLDDAERIDLIAHELAHDINNDNSSNFFIGLASNTLFRLHEVLYPERLFPTEVGFWAFTALPFTIASLGLSHVVRWCALGMQHLLWSSQQKAEYYADILAATVSGKKASLSGFRKSLLRDVFHTEVQRMVLQRTTQEDLFYRLVNSIGAVPEREKERLLRAENQRANRMHISHPPIPLRIRMVAELAPEQPSFAVPSSLMENVAREMDSLKPEVQAVIIDNYRASIYD